MQSVKLKSEIEVIQVQVSGFHCLPPFGPSCLSRLPASALRL